VLTGWGYITGLQRFGTFWSVVVAIAVAVAVTVWLARRAHAASANPAALMPARAASSS